MPSAFSYDPTNPMAPVVVAIGVVFLILTWILIAARFVARRQIRSIGMDDLWILPCQICFTVYVVSLLEMHKAVPGEVPATLGAARTGVKWFIVSVVMYAWCMLFLKVSLGLFFLRIIANKTQRYVVYATIATSTVANLFISIWTVTNCGVHGDYVFKMAMHDCPRLNVQLGVAYTQAGVNIATDIVLACIPFLILRQSFLTRRLKISVICILVLATAGCISSILRFAFISAVFVRRDLVKAVILPALVSTIELSTGIICSSLATLKPLLTRTKVTIQERPFAIKCELASISVVNEQEFPRPAPAHVKSQAGRASMKKNDPEYKSWFLEKTLDEPETGYDVSDDELLKMPDKQED